MDKPEKGDPVTMCMDLNNTKIKSDGIINKFKLMILVRGDRQIRI